MNTHGRPGAEPFFPWAPPPYVADGPVIPIMPIFADQPRAPSRHQSTHFDTPSERKYARKIARQERSLEILASLASNYYSSSDPTGSPFDPSFSEAGYHGALPPKQPRTHCCSRKSRTHDYSENAFFPPGLAGHAEYQPGASYKHIWQRDEDPQPLQPRVHHRAFDRQESQGYLSCFQQIDDHQQLEPRVHHRVFDREESQGYPSRFQQDYRSHDTQPVPEQPAVNGCAVPHGGHIVPLVTCPHNMLGCIVCGRCYHDE